MKRRPFLVERTAKRRSLTRMNPEAAMIDGQEHLAWSSGAANNDCPVRDALDAAYAAFSGLYGDDDAKAWAVRQASANLPAIVAPAKKRARQAGDALFEGRAA